MIIQESFDKLWYYADHYWAVITKRFKFHEKHGSFFYYKTQQSFITKRGSYFIVKHVDFVKKCGRCYKTRQFCYKTLQLLQNACFITKSAIRMVLVISNFSKLFLKNKVDVTTSLRCYKQRWKRLQRYVQHCVHLLWRLLFILTQNDTEKIVCKLGSLDWNATDELFSIPPKNLLISFDYFYFQNKKFLTDTKLTTIAKPDSVKFEFEDEIISQKRYTQLAATRSK